MREIIVSGRLVDNAEVKIASNGRSYLTFRLANTENPIESTYYFDVTCFDSYIIANYLQYLGKGSAVDVIGELRAKPYKKNNGEPEIDFRISANMIKFHGLMKKKSDNNVSVDGMETVVEEPPTNPVGQDVTSDDLPF